MHSGGQRSSMGRQSMFSLAHCSRARLHTVAQCTAKPSWVQNAHFVLEAAAPIITTLGIGAAVVSPTYIVTGKVERMDAEFKQMVKKMDRVVDKLDRVEDKMDRVEDKLNELLMQRRR